MEQNELRKWGPLAALIGKWEGDKGDDKAPDDDRGTENNKYRETVLFEPIGPTKNHEQCLYSLRYSLTAVRTGETDPFHEEYGYWHWDEAAGQVYRSTIIPRGLAMLSGGPAGAGDRELKLSAKVDSPVFGICSNPFLDREFKTVAFDIKVTILGDRQFKYEQDTQMRMKGRTEIFHHTDQNILTRTGQAE